MGTKETSEAVHMQKIADEKKEKRSHLIAEMINSLSKDEQRVIVNKLAIIKTYMTKDQEKT